MFRTGCVCYGLGTVPFFFLFCLVLLPVSWVHCCALSGYPNIYFVRFIPWFVRLFVKIIHEL